MPKKSELSDAKCIICSASLGESHLHSSDGLPGGIDRGVLCTNESIVPRGNRQTRLWFGLCKECFELRRNYMFTFEYGTPYTTEKA